MKTLIPQIFEELETVSSRDKKIKLLRSYAHPVLRGILQINFNPDVKVLLPEGTPPYKKDETTPYGYSETNLYAEFRRFYIWLDEKVNIHKIKKEQLFIQFLEGLHWKEAEVICLAKDKKLQTKYKSLKEDIVREAFPNLLPPPKEIVKPVAKKKQPSLKESETSL
jgi:hypothetical protein